MGSNHFISIGLVASGAVRILTAYLLVFALTRLTSRPRTRHVLWLLFLTGAGFYWFALVRDTLTPRPFADVPSHSILASAPASTSSAASTITVPFAWDHGVGAAAEILLWAYIVGLITMLSRLARRRHHLRRAIARSRPVPPALHLIFVDECRRLKVSRCGIIELPGLGSPGTAYSWKPLVIVPDGLDAYLDNEQLVDVLYHELIHVRRLDFLWSTLAETIGCLLFFHPAIWLALRNLGRERELACDMAVIDLRQGRRSDYALCLTRLARRRVIGLKFDPPSHLALLNSFLAFRVQTLLAENRRRSRPMGAAAAFASVAAVFIFFAGWSSLSFAIQLAPPAATNAPLSAQNRRSPSTRSATSQHNKSVRPSVQNRSPQPDQPVQRTIPQESTELRHMPVAFSQNRDADDSPSAVKPSREVSPVSTIWDETAASQSGQGAPPSKSTVIGNAIDILGRLAQGRRGDGGGDIDDRGPRSH